MRKKGEANKVRQILGWIWRESAQHEDLRCRTAVVEAKGSWWVNVLVLVGIPSTFSNRLRWSPRSESLQSPSTLNWGGSGLRVGSVVTVDQSRRRQDSRSRKSIRTGQRGRKAEIDVLGRSCWFALMTSTRVEISKIVTQAMHFLNALVSFH